MKAHKAQLSSSFSYIFALVVGGIVFLFFVGFAYKYLGFSGALSGAELVNSLNDEFAAFSASDAAEKNLQFTQAVVLRVVDGSLVSEGQTKRIDHIVFAPLTLEGKEVFLATRSLELPYRVGNLFYVVDQRMVYVLVTTSESEAVVEGLQASYAFLPSTFPVMVVSFAELEADPETFSGMVARYEVVRFVVFGSAASTRDALEGLFPDAEILEVSSTLEDYSAGDIEFQNGEESIYIGYPLLLGAMLAPDAQSYDAALARVFEKLSRVTGVYYDKAKFVSARLPACDYAPVKTSLNNYKVFVGDVENLNSVSVFLAKLALVEEANKDLGGECPEIY